MKRKQSVLEASARDRNWLLGRLTAAERTYNKVLWDALEYADTGYRDTCRKHRLAVNRSKVYTYQRAASSMIQDVRARVNAHFAGVRFVHDMNKPVELSREQVVEPVHDYSSSTETTKP